MINSMEDAVVYMLAQRGRALSHPNKVINEHINMGHQARVEEERWLEIRGQTTGVEHKCSGGDQRIS